MPTKKLSVKIILFQVSLYYLSYDWFDKSRSIFMNIKNIPILDIEIFTLATDIFYLKFIVVTVQSRFNTDNLLDYIPSL